MSGFRGGILNVECQTFNGAPQQQHAYKRTLSILRVKHLQEVVRRPNLGVERLIARRRVEGNEGVLHVLIHLHDGSLVTAAIAVVWCREDGHDAAVVRPLVALHHELMCARNEIQLVCVVKLLCHVLTERVPRAAR